MYHNYSIKSSKGVFYSSSKTKDSTHTVESVTDKGTYYHEEVKEVSGILTGLQISEPEWGGKQLKVYLEDGEDINVIQMNIFNEKDQIEDWVREALKFIPNLDLGKKYIFALNRTKKREGKDGKSYLWRNMYVSEDLGAETVKVEWAIAKEDIPEADEKTKRDGTKTYDYTKRDDFYWDLLQKQIDRIAQQKDGVEKPKEAVANEEGPSDLPF